MLLKSLFHWLLYRVSYPIVIYFINRFSDEEMLELKKLITVHGKKLLLISTLMGRNPTYIEFQFKQIEREERNCVTGMCMICINRSFGL